MNAPVNTTGDSDPPPIELTGWGNYPRAHGRLRLSEDLERITDGASLTRGLGRSYGDASLPAGGDRPVAGSPLADRVLAFDLDTGVVRVEAGLPLRHLNHLSVPRNWFTPVSPGTHWVTVGGMVAADVHGKNHHVAGTFGQHVRALRLRVADGRILDIDDAREPELFRATIGGMGLTGHILEVEFAMERIPTAWIWQESEQVRNFDEALERLEAAGRQWPYTALWSDMIIGEPHLGRGLLMKGRWATLEEAPAEPPRWHGAVALPFALPSWALQRWMLAIGNRLNYWKHGARPRTGVVHPETCFYPLDVLHRWNGLYGGRGFTQYQAVLPGPHSHPRHRRLLRALRQRGGDVFLCVIKDCGAAGKGLLSYPRPGVSYAFDIPMGRYTQAVVDALNEVVVEEGGRIYLAKDALTCAEHYRAMEGERLTAFTALRDRWDPERRLRSALSVRLLGDAA